MDAFEKGERDRQILKHLARGERETKAGRGFTLDEVLEEAEELLDRPR